MIRHSFISGRKLIGGDGIIDPRKKIHVIWEGTQLATTSFAIVNRELCSGIIDSGIAELTAVPYEPDQFAPEGNAKFERLFAHDIRVKGFPIRDRSRRPHVWVRHQWPPRSKPPGKARLVIMYSWEYSAIPRYYTDIFDAAEEIWTPSSFSRDAFVRSGISPSKVHVIPCGVDTGVFSPEGPTMGLPTSKRFKLLFVGGTIYRKGVDILLESYSRAFSSKDDVCLVIKDVGITTLYKGQTSEGLIGRYQAGRGPEILHLKDELSEPEMAGLYRSCDVFVSSYRGEGFSLPTLEAMSCGLPVIVTGGGATDDFVDEDVGWTVNAGKRAVGSMVYGQKMEGECFLLEPDRDHLAEIMRIACSSPSGIVNKGIKGALRARSSWTWRDSVKRLLSRAYSMCGLAMDVEEDKIFGETGADPMRIKKAIEEKAKPDHG